METLPIRPEEAHEEKDVLDRIDLAKRSPRYLWDEVKERIKASLVPK